MNTYLGYTNDRVAEIVQENISEEHALMKQLNEGIKGPIFSLKLLTELILGPRYCPSLEIKCLRFPHLKHRVNFFTQNLLNFPF